MLRAESDTLIVARCAVAPPAGGGTSLATRPRTVTVCIFASGISMLRNCAPGATSTGAAAVGSVVRGNQVVTYSSSACGCIAFWRSVALR